MKEEEVEKMSRKSSSFTLKPPHCAIIFVHSYKVIINQIKKQKIMLTYIPSAYHQKKKKKEVTTQKNN